MDFGANEVGPDHASHPGEKGSGRGEDETVSIGVIHRSGRLFWSAGSLSEGGMSSWSESGRVMKASKGMVADELGSTKGSHVRVVLWCSVLGFGSKIRGEEEWTRLCGSVWVLTHHVGPVVKRVATSTLVGVSSSSWTRTR